MPIRPTSTLLPFLLSALLLVILNPVSAGDLPPGFAEVLVAQNLDPTAMALAPDGRIFIAEKNGKILIVDNGELLPDPFMIHEVDNYNERGLSGIAFDPDFESNGFLYIYYTVKGENHNRLSRITADGNNMLPGSEVVLLNLDQLSGTIHNAGALAFGPDGKLYISVGDGAYGPNAQDLTSLLGKVLRINRDGSVPEDNPFYNQTSGMYRAIYSMGHRNPFSLTIQPGTGRIFSSEVGASAWEEVNEILPGKNYGWPIIEGPLNGQTPPSNYKEPVFTYSHADGCAAVAAAFYNPLQAMFPAQYIGKFFFADYCRGYIKYMDPDVPGIAQTFATNINRPLNFLVAPDGTFYYLARAGLGGGSELDNTSTDNGTLWRVFYTGSNKPFVSVNPQSILVSKGEEASFRMAASGAAPLSYQWQQNNADIPGANSTELILSNVMLSDSGAVIRCIVSNASGSDTTNEAILRVTSNQRPAADILTPINGTTYRGGDTLNFSGQGIDPETGTLDPASLRWKIDFHHHTHTHPALIPTAGISGGQYIVPQTGETSDDVWYQIYFTATDPIGLSQTVTREIFPVKTQFHVETVPEGLPVYVEGDYLTTPVTVTSVVGIIRRVEAIGTIRVGDSLRVFTKWVDGSTDLVRNFTAADDTVTFTALYETIAVGKGIGLRGYYYDNPPYDPTFYEPYKFTWIDTTIDFDWGDGSPAVSQLGNDFWLVRWIGYVEPLFTDNYTFHVRADDGTRLWVDNQQLIDAWIPQPPTEWEGSIPLQAGKRYPIQLEFFEEGGGAVCQLSWSSNRITQSIIPRSQLYPAYITAVPVDHQLLSDVHIYPNPARDKIFVQHKNLVAGLKELSIHNDLGDLVMSRKEGLEKEETEINVVSLAKGIYWLQYVLENGVAGTVEFVKL